MSFEKMGDHVVLRVERLRKSQKVNTISGAEDSAPDFSSSLVAESSDEEENLIGDEEIPMIQVVDCRICQEEDHMENLEVPCACNGSLKYAHRACIQHWCNEKGDTTCEICHVQYKPGYTTPQIHLDETTIDIHGSWLVTGSTLDLHDRRLLAMTAHRHLVEADYDGYASNDSGSVFCRSVTLILMALLLLRHALIINNADGNESDNDVEDASAFFSLFLLRVVGFLLPCYFMAWVITIMQRQRERQEAAGLAATGVAFILQSGRHRDSLPVSLAPDSPSTPQQELQP
ncbi:uncharacterized protein LOC141824290 isoform X2 [Curcuma longa]|uniref:uncharacterized protein LOC141824290 isoform X2 n=1 Tax=Curcuma longa TaxID=136217 RepID=UPI003D9E66E2